MFPCIYFMFSEPGLSKYGHLFDLLFAVFWIVTVVTSFYLSEDFRQIRSIRPSVGLILATILGALLMGRSVGVACY